MTSAEESLGSRVRTLRSAAGLSQHELAGDVLSSSYVSLIETGRREPTAAAVELLAARLGTTVSYLLTGVEQRPVAEVRLQLSAAEMALRNGDPHLALDSYLTLSGSLDRVRQRSLWRSAVAGLARAQERLGDLKTATVTLELLRGESGPGDTEPTWVGVLIDLVRCYREGGDRNLAQRIAEDALAVFDTLGNPGGPEEVSLANTLIATYYETGDWLRASTLADLTLARAEESGDLNARATSYWTASQLAQATGELGLALDYSERAMVLFAEGDKDRNTAMATVYRAWVLLMQDTGNAGEALALLRPVLTRLEAEGDDLPLAYCRLEAARANVHLGNGGEAGVLADLAAEAFAAAGNADGAIGATIVRAQAAQQSGQLPQARALLRQAAARLREQPIGRAQAELWVGIATTSEGLGELRDALAAYAEATRAAGVLTPPTPPGHERTPPPLMPPVRADRG